MTGLDRPYPSAHKAHKVVLPVPAPSRDYYRRTPPSDAEVFIQWKGTDACMDFYCPCGAQGHYDGYFAYAVKCPVCGSVFKLGTQVNATKYDGPPGVEDYWYDNAKVLDVSDADLGGRQR